MVDKFHNKVAKQQNFGKCETNPFEIHLDDCTSLPLSSVDLEGTVRTNYGNAQTTIHYSTHCSFYRFKLSFNKTPNRRSFYGFKMSFINTCHVGRSFYRFKLHSSIPNRLSWYGFKMSFINT